jgi:uroporphyrinogen-III decarboxylase
MTSRERVLCALNHEEPDRVPIFFGTSGVTTMNTAAYDRLKDHLGLRTETRAFWRALQYAALDEEVMSRFHSDGNIYPLLPDLIEIGMDILNPVHVAARDMGDTARLKREFGDRLAFCGAIDTQSVLPYGTPDEVRFEVRRRIRDLAPGGGYILASVHCLQPDVPPENVCALFEEAFLAGRYPLAL